MHNLTASLPRHLYGQVHRSFITNHQEDAGWEHCIIHAMSCRPAQVITFSILLESGAQYRGVPIHALHLGQHPGVVPGPVMPISHHQMWGCFGTMFHLVVMTFNEHLSAQYLDLSGDWVAARGLGLSVEFHDDGYSAAPHQDKSFNFLVTEQNKLVAMPNNRIRWWESSFTNWALPINLRVNHQVYLVESMQENPETTALVQER